MNGTRKGSLDMLERLAKSVTSERIYSRSNLALGLREAADGSCELITKDGSRMVSETMAGYFVLEMLGYIRIGKISPGCKPEITEAGRRVYESLMNDGVYDTPDFEQKPITSGRDEHGGIQDSGREKPNIAGLFDSGEDSSDESGPPIEDENVPF